MQVVFDPDSQLNLRDFGLSVPLLDQRAHLVANYLQSQAPKAFLIPKDIIAWDLEELTPVHTNEYKELLQTRPEEAIMEAYELIRDGQYHRYDPKLAKRSLGELLPIVLKQASLTYFTANKALNLGCAFYLGGGCTMQKALLEVVFA